jgi:hypothetical protein
MRAMNPGGALRLGVFGSLSLINSPIASRVKMIGVYLNPIKAIGVPDTASSPIRAAQLVTAGEVIARNPDTIPSTNATTITINMRVSFPWLEISHPTPHAWIGIVCFKLRFRHPAPNKNIMQSTLNKQNISSLR